MIIIGKSINGVTINGCEWLIDSNNDYMRFNRIEEEQIFLFDNGYNEKEIEYFNFKEI